MTPILNSINSVGENINRYGLAGTPEEDGMGERFREFCKTHAEHVGAEFLENSYGYATEEIGLDGDEFIGEMVDAVLGDHYPTPDRVLPNTQKIIRRYLDMTMCNEDPPEGTMDLFLTEGGTAAMTYVFNSLKENHLLNPGDKIALGTPIFTPYLEIPPLTQFFHHSKSSIGGPFQGRCYDRSKCRDLFFGQYSVFFTEGNLSTLRP